MIIVSHERQRERERERSTCLPVLGDTVVDVVDESNTSGVVVVLSDGAVRKQPFIYIYIYIYIYIVICLFIY